MRNGRIHLLTCTSLILACVGIGQAQQFTGGVRGSVRDGDVPLAVEI